MADSTLAGVITACASVLTALGLLVTALTLFIPILRQTRRNTAQVQQVHKLVDGQHTALQEYQATLVEALKRGGVDVPVEQPAPPLAHDPAAPVPATTHPPAPPV